MAPAQTLTDKEYQLLRNASIQVLREIGVDTGGSNVQFAIDPDTGRMVVIEMNPRVSRSSALASKATGFPIAKVAAKLAVGYTLDELENDITGGVTPASFEPSIDYVVTKIPRFTFEKFPQADPRLTTQMKSVGEVMAIGPHLPGVAAEGAAGAWRPASRGLDPVLGERCRKRRRRRTLEGSLAPPARNGCGTWPMPFAWARSLEDIHELTRDRSLVPGANRGSRGRGARLGGRRACGTERP